MLQVQLNRNILRYKMRNTRYLPELAVKQNQTINGLLSWQWSRHIFVFLGFILLTIFPGRSAWALGESLPVEISVKQSNVHVTIDHEKIVDYSLKRQLFHKGRAINIKPEKVLMFILEGDGNKETFLMQKKADFADQIEDGFYSEKLTINALPRDYQEYDKPMVYDRWLYYQVENGSIKYINPSEYSERMDPTFYEMGLRGKLQAYKKGGGLAAKFMPVRSKPGLDIPVKTKPILQLTTKNFTDRSEAMER